MRANLDRYDGATIFFITEQAKETVFEFSQGTVKVLWIQIIVQLLSVQKDAIQ